MKELTNMDKQSRKMESFLLDESGTIEVQQQLHNSYASGVIDEFNSGGNNVVPESSVDE